MDLWTEYGAAGLMAVCLLEALGLPLPAAVALLTAGGLAAVGRVGLGTIYGAATAAFLVGDLLYFWLGRRGGWWLLGTLCRLSTNPDSCVLTSAEAFHRRGRPVLLICKFIPGLNTMSPPLAGAMGMPLGEFLLWDIGGIVLYVGTYVGIGFLFQDLLTMILALVNRAGDALWVLVGASVAGVLAYRIWRAWRGPSLGEIPRVEARDVDGPVFDVRGHGYYEPAAKRIAGSQRLDVDRLAETVAFLPEGEKIYLYCS